LVYTKKDSRDPLQAKQAKNLYDPRTRHELSNSTTHLRIQFDNAKDPSEGKL